MHGDEGLRLTAAECLAKSLPEGHEVLKEAIELEDILVRRAVVFGLSQIRELWVISLLEKVTIQDAQWVVRNGASQALEALQQPNPSIPHYLPDPADTPWLITFASKQGLGVSPNQPATDILLRALEAGDADEQVASLHYLRQTQEDRVMLELFKVIYGRQLPVREAAYNALWYLAISGATIPSPEKFGYG
jgi:HEAT repeat protein